MFLDQNEKSIKVFLTGETLDQVQDRNRLQAILESAGMQVLHSNTDEDTYRILCNADCSLHVLGNTYSDILENHYTLASKYRQENSDFRIFIWQPPKENNEVDTLQEQFINTIRNNISGNMIFSKQESCVMLAEDMRSIMFEEKRMDFDLQETEIFFIYNEIDEDAVVEITEIISDVASIQTLNIVLSNSTDYAQLVARQIEKARLTVIFFKRSAMWALPFAQQIWKNIGGASSNSKILLIGDSDHDQNVNAKFDAPNVTSVVVHEELIPLEIKVQFDKLTFSKS